MEIQNLVANPVTWIIGGTVLYLLMWTVMSIHQQKRYRRLRFSVGPYERGPARPRWFAIGRGIWWPIDFIESVSLLLGSGVHWFSKPV